MARYRKPLWVGWLGLSCLVLTACGGSLRLDSPWRDRRVAVDGQDSEWAGIRYGLADSRVTMGVMNDADSLYVTVSLADPSTAARLARRGFTVWFDPAGGKRRVLGVRFPVPTNDATAGTREGLDRELARGDAPGQRRGTREARMRDRPEARQLQSLLDSVFASTQMEVIGPAEGQLTRAGISGEGPVTLAASCSGGRLVYELRLPLGLVSDSLRRQSMVALGFEVPEPDLDDARDRRGGRRGPEAGGMGGSGPGAGEGARGPGGMGRRGGEAGEAGEGGAGEESRFWIRVVLARGPVTTGE